MALALLIAVLELLGAVGLFRLLPIVVACVAVGAGTCWVVGVAQGVPRRAAWRRDWVDTGQATSALTLALSLLGAAAVFAVWASPMLQILRRRNPHLRLPLVPPPLGRLVRADRAHHAAAVHRHRVHDCVLSGERRAVPLARDRRRSSRDTLSPALNFLWLGLTLARGILHRASARVRARPRCPAPRSPWRPR